MGKSQSSAPAGGALRGAAQGAWLSTGAGPVTAITRGQKERVGDVCLSILSGCARHPLGKFRVACLTLDGHVPVYAAFNTGQEVQRSQGFC